MHVSRTSRNAVTRIEVIPHSAAYHDSKREVLSLRISHSCGPLSVNPSEATTYFKVGHNPPVTLNKITPHTNVESGIPCFRPSRNHSEGWAERQIRIAA